MGSYKLSIRRSAEKEIIGLPKEDRHRVVTRIHKLATDPRPHRSEKLKGDDTYRVRQGDYRIIYIVADEERLVTIEKVGHRREVYR